jgi:hypothetical protein
MKRNIFNIFAAFIFGGIIMGFLGVEALMNATPPISRDALVHHLALPKLWIRHGNFYQIPWATFSYYPMNIQVIYFFCLYLKNDVAPKFIHMAFGWGTGLCIYFYLKQKLNFRWGLLGLIIFSTTPIVVWLCTSAYIDLGMLFFSTASILAFVKWRDLRYNGLKWFMLSSVCMGIALGCKYNALIVWLIVNLLLPFYFVRDGHSQLKAMKFGALFFLIAAAVASPWYVKNYILTGNPFYPLFNVFFSSLQQGQVSGSLSPDIVAKSGKTDLFQMREIMYGESLLETLLIPLRMFFQGDDYSYRYFQGRLNPILILFAPFLFYDKTKNKDKLFFVVIIGFYMVIAFFLSRKQVRYLTPVLPFLSILAVMGIKGLIDQIFISSVFAAQNPKFKRAIKYLIFAIVIGLLSLNGLYLKYRMNIIRPWPYILGKETKENFLRRHLSYFPAVEAINQILFDDAIVYTFFLGRQGYYFERSYRNDSSFGMNALKALMQGSDSRQAMQKTVRALGATHILMRKDLTLKYLQDNFVRQDIVQFITRINQSWKIVYNDDKYTVWDIRS